MNAADSPGSISREILSHTVTAEEAGLTLRALLRGRLSVSRGLLRKLKGCRGIHVDGQPERVTRVLRAGEHVRLLLPDRPVYVEPEPIPLDVLHEDADLLVINKPPRMVVHPAGSHRAGTLVNAVVHHLAARGEACTPRPVHRLDKDTSGAIVFAKHHYSDQRLARQLKSGELRREYLAVVAGLVPGPGTVDLPIDRGAPGRAPNVSETAGAPAVTHFAPLRRWGGRLPDLPCGATLLAVRLETGRTHQIRLHLAAIGHPLLGDRLHGVEVPRLIERQALHAVRVSLRHPRCGDVLRCEAPPPPDWLALLAALGPPL